MRSLLVCSLAVSGLLLGSGCSGDQRLGETDSTTNGGAGESGGGGSASAGSGGTGQGGSAAGQSGSTRSPRSQTLVTTGSHSCAILEGGRVRCWGDNQGALLGYGLGQALRTPAQLGSVLVDGAVTQVTARHDHACALRGTGAVRCWGYGLNGSLGYGSSDGIGDDEPASTAGDVPVGGKAVQVTTGNSHTCALLDTGHVRCWGDGENGRLGHGNTNSIGDDEPASAAGDVPVGGKVVQISAGGVHTCALLDTGHVRCWGANGFGQLGSGTTEWIGDDEPASAGGDVDVGGKVVQISAGYDHTCALLDTGAVRCWGHGLNGQLGHGNASNVGDDESVASAGDVPVGGEVVQISAGYDHTCATLAGGDVTCWGGGNEFADPFDLNDILPYATRNVGDDEPASALGDVLVGGNAVSLTGHESHTCALLDTGAVRCWGTGDGGALGYGNPNSIGDDEPASAAGDVPVDGTVVQVSAGDVHTCALLDTGHVRCWGAGFLGELGYGNPNSIGDDEPASAAGDVPVGGKVVQISAGGVHTCALLDTGHVRCWGANGFGQLGSGTTEWIGDDEPASAGGDVDVGGRVVQISAGWYHTCALLDTGALRCWGQGKYGLLGHGNTKDVGDDETPASAGDVPIGGKVMLPTP